MSLYASGATEIIEAASHLTWPGAIAVCGISFGVAGCAFAAAWYMRGMFR